MSWKMIRNNCKFPKNTYQSSYYISFLHCEWVLIKSLKLYTFWRFQLIFPWLQRWDAIVFSKFIDWKLFQTTPRNTCNVHLKYTIPSTPHTKHNTQIDQKCVECCTCTHFVVHMFILSLVWGTLSEVDFSLEARVNSVLIFFCTADGAKLLDFDGEKHKRLPRNRYWFSSRIISHSIILAENSLSLLLSATVLLRLNFGGRFIISSDIPIDRDVNDWKLCGFFHVGWNRIGS